MKKQEREFAIETKNGVIQRIGRSTIYQPKTNCKGKGIRWFNDKKSIKK